MLMNTQMNRRLTIVTIKYTCGFVVHDCAASAEMIPIIREAENKTRYVFIIPPNQSKSIVHYSSASVLINPVN